MAESCQRLRIPSLSSFLKSSITNGHNESAIMRKEHRRVVVMGASRVGKTCIIQQFLYDKFEKRYKRTIEQLHRADYELADGSALTLDILDTCGSHEFPAMRALSITTAGAFILVYAVDDAYSWEEVERLWSQIMEMRSTSTPIVIVANKMDLSEEERKLQHEVLEMIALEEWNCGYVQCSAKNNVGIVQIFKEVLKQSKIQYNLSPAVQRRRQSLPTAFNSVQNPQSNHNNNNNNYKINESPVHHTVTSMKRHSCTMN